MAVHQRPGVYSDYEVSSVYSGIQGAGTVAVAAMDDADARVYTVHSAAEAAEVFDTAGDLYGLAVTAIQNGAGTVEAYPVQTATTAGYQAAFSALLGRKTARFIVCDSPEGTVQAALGEALDAAAQEQNECIGLVGMAEPTATQLTQRAALLNRERLVLAGPDCCLTGQTETAGGWYLAAAMAGFLAAQTDPAAPLNGAELAGIGSISDSYTENQLDTLILGGVTVAESVDGTASVIRAVTTRTTTGGVADGAWRELSTVLIVDTVIPALRRRLAARFARSRNNAATRSAIRAQVVLELTDRVKREQIERFENLTVETNSQDPTICDVAFDFTVVYGLSRICVTAHITV